MLSYEDAHRIFRYDPESGLLYRKKRGPRGKPDHVVGNPYSNGYLRVSIGGQSNKREYLLHRLIWMMQHGEWPDGEIDHINRIRTDNRISNLRICTNAENKQNLSLRSNNTSGYTGVSYWKAMGKWRADITVNHKIKHLGRFDTPEEAYSAYLAAKAELHTFNPVPH